MEVKIRYAGPGDLNFIKATWLRSLRFGSKMHKNIPSDLYYKRYGAFIEDTFKRTTIGLVACLPDDSDLVLGYAILEVYKPDVCVLHWTYVKKPFREQGIATKLLSQHMIDAYSHQTKCSKFITKERWAYNPFLITERIKHED